MSLQAKQVDPERNRREAISKASTLPFIT